MTTLDCFQDLREGKKVCVRKSETLKKGKGVMWKAIIFPPLDLIEISGLKNV